MLAPLAPVLILNLALAPAEVAEFKIAISGVPTDEDVFVKFVPSNVSADPVVSTLEPSR